MEVPRLRVRLPFLCPSRLRLRRFFAKPLHGLSERPRRRRQMIETYRMLGKEREADLQRLARSANAGRSSRNAWVPRGHAPRFRFGAALGAIRFLRPMNGRARA